MPEETQSQPTQTEAQATNGQQSAATSAATENTDPKLQEQTVPYARFKEVNEKLKALEDSAAQHAAAQAKAEEERLAQQQEWQKLADSRKAKVDELSPKAELADRLSAMVATQYQDEIKEWPEQVRNMAPADDADILTKLDWMQKARPLATELMADKTPAPGNGRRPVPVSPAGATKATEQERVNYATRARARYK